MSALILILGDQLNIRISSLQRCVKEDDIVLLCENKTEASYVKHHKKKLVLVFSAMRHFADELIQRGYNVEYSKLNDSNNTGSFNSECIRIIKQHNIDELVVTMPGEFRVLNNLEKLKKDVTLTILPDTRFYSHPEEFRDWACNYKQLRMENFYRMLRKEHQILMENDKPVGGQWNFDKENRKFPKLTSPIEQPLDVQPDKITQDVLKMVEDNFDDHFGDLRPFNYATTRDKALKVFNHFLKYRLKYFGDYQDAMIEDEPFMYHSLISFYLNIGLLLPKEVVTKVERTYQKGDIPINAAEGFIRQVLGWREYIRGVYWLKMPEYSKSNFFNARRKLPSFFWSGDTKLNCVKQCINQTKQYAYAHHIQRLMVLGNFLLLAGVHPDEVNEWYLIVYADAFEWVELPNVTGMILFADGGYLASKPYAASGSYINKMSNYCSDCEYKVKEKSGENACPFNYLYWHFLDKHKNKLSSNQRLSMIYASMNKFSDSKLNQIRRDSAKFLKSI